MKVNWTRIQLPRKSRLLHLTGRSSVNEFLTFRRYALLPDKGSISREEADKKAEEEYRLFDPSQKIDSDFDNFVKGLFD